MGWPVGWTQGDGNEGFCEVGCDLERYVVWVQIFSSEDIWCSKIPRDKSWERHYESDVGSSEEDPICFQWCLVAAATTIIPQRECKWWALPMWIQKFSHGWHLYCSGVFTLRDLVQHHWFLVGFMVTFWHATEESRDIPSHSRFSVFENEFLELHFVNSLINSDFQIISNHPSFSSQKPI